MDCPICYELTNNYITTNCNHNFCINCIMKLCFCAICRTELTKSKLCREIRQKYLKTNINENTNPDTLYVPLSLWNQPNPGFAIPFAYLSYDEGYVFANLNTGETTIIPFTQEYVENLVTDA